MIYCGYQGVGKSTYCRENPDTSVDLDSSNFKKCPTWYVDYVKMALSFQNKDVFISAHREVIEYLIRQNVDFKVLIPGEEEDVWEARLKFRYCKVKSFANLKALHDFHVNFKSDMIYYNNLEKRGVQVCRVKARIKTTLADCL